MPASENSDWLTKTNSVSNYRTVQDYGEATIVIKKSRFIAQVWPVQTEAEALKFLVEVQKKHYAANHHCFAYQIGLNNQIQKASDAGEPAGTAGKPILEVIKREELKNGLVIVTRYFGGTLLGAGGLVRAYGQAASAGIAAAGIVTRRLIQIVQVDIDYTWLGKVEHETHNTGYTIAHLDYLEQVRLFVQVPLEYVEKYTTLITNATNGQAKILPGEQLYM